MRGLEELVEIMNKEYDTVKFDIAVVYGDRHTGIEDAPSDIILKKYIRDNKKDIKYVIDLGDGIDNPFMSDWPVDPKFKLTAQDELDMYAAHWNEINKLVPNATKVIIPGNHDSGRIIRSKNLKRGLASLRNLEYKNMLGEAFDQVGLDVEKFIVPDVKYEAEFIKGQKDVFTHGDPRLDPNIKGGACAVRRTAEMYPSKGNIFMGHGHWYQTYPRKFPGTQCVMLGMMANIPEMEAHYVNFHPYDNGFGIIRYNRKEGLCIFDYVRIQNGLAVIDGKQYGGLIK